MRSTEIFGINLLRIWCVYVESRISRKMLHKTHLFWLLLEVKGCLSNVWLDLEAKDQKQISSTLILTHFTL